MKDLTEFIPLRLQQARICRMLDESELENILKFAYKTEVSIRRIEMGMDEPNAFLINVLSYVLDFPVGFFYKPMPQINFATSVLFACENIEH